jgi:hypothetical protein
MAGRRAISGEAAPRATVCAEALERAFGPAAICNACGARIPDYRVVAAFLHETVAIRAYCATCYPAAADGDYHAGGDGLLLDFAGFTRRFGSAGPPPPPATPVDRLFTALIRDPSLRVLSPANEAVARRRRQVPYPVRVALWLEGRSAEARLTVSAPGAILELSGDPDACARVRELTASAISDGA